MLLCNFPLTLVTVLVLMLAVEVVEVVVEEE